MLVVFATSDLPIHPKQRRAVCFLSAVPPRALPDHFVELWKTELLHWFNQVIVIYKLRTQR